MGGFGWGMVGLWGTLWFAVAMLCVGVIRFSG